MEGVQPGTRERCPLYIHVEWLDDEDGDGDDGDDDDDDDSSNNKH